MQNPSSRILWSLGGITAASFVLLGAGCKTATESKAPAAAASTTASTAASTAGMLPVPVHIRAGVTNDLTTNGVTWIGYGSYFADGDTIERRDPDRQHGQCGALPF